MSDPKVTALDLPAADPLPDDIAAYFAKCEEKLGLTPWVLRAYAFAPEKLRAFMAMYNDLMLGDSGLSKLEREMIAVVVSAVNRCLYCLVAHGAMARRKFGHAPVQRQRLAEGRIAGELAHRRAMGDEASARIVEADRQALRDAGFSDRDIWDIASVAAFFAMSNRLASAVAMRPNPEYHAMAR